MTIEIMIGDVFEQLRKLNDESIDCIVTSPPYWGLRDYGIDGQLGLEPSLGEHIQKMVEVFRELKRVLKKTGTCWVNYGDCYATSPNGRSAVDTKKAGNDDRTFRDKPFSTIGPIFVPDCDVRGSNLGNMGGEPRGRIVAGGYLKPKDLCMIPNRLAIALQDDGWWIRSEIIWHKPNAMPESITDRPATSHEKIFLITKAPKYFYDAEAVKSVVKDKWGSRHREGGKYHKEGTGLNPHGGLTDDYETANLRNVWTIPTAGFSDAHFATFPPALPEVCIKAGCPIGGIVLDPFGGAGTTGLVADRLGRNAILIELNPEYVKIASKRIMGDAPLFTELSTTKE